MNSIRFDLIAKHLSDLIAVIAFDGRFLYTSPSYQRIGYSSDMLSSINAFDLVHPEDLPLVREIVESFIASGTERRGIRFDCRLRTSFGDYIEIEASGTLIKDQTGEVTVYAISRDVTEQRQVERIKTELVSTTAHELRTPLVSIVGFSELLLTRTDLSDEERQKYLGIVNSQSVRMAKMIDGLLDLSRMEKGEAMGVDYSEFKLQSAVSEQVQVFKKSHPDHCFLLDQPEHALIIRADRVKVVQVLNNLLSNAVKYSPGGSEVQVNVKKRDRHALISVRDKGIGMGPEQTEKIFDRFYRVDSSNTAPQGLGLGLSIVRHIIESHGGEIWVESVLREGTSFHFTLPLGESPPASPS